jgi:hypothetical protein
VMNTGSRCAWQKSEISFVLRKSVMGRISGICVASFVRYYSIIAA